MSNINTDQTTALRKLLSTKRAQSEKWLLWMLIRV